jgi:hypothetical protein
MALFNECTQSCVHIVLDMADIVRDGDLSLTRPLPVENSFALASHRQRCRMRRHH